MQAVKMQTHANPSSDDTKQTVITGKLFNNIMQNVSIILPVNSVSTNKVNFLIRIEDGPVSMSMPLLP